MKKALILLAVISMASWAMGAPSMSFPVSKDSGGDSGAQDGNSGAATMVRGAKATWLEDWSYYDWDTAEVEAYIAANGGMGMVSKVYFGLFPNTLWARDETDPDNIGIRVYGIHSRTDWVEGDGTSMWGPAFNWSAGTAAVTENYAQCMWMDDGAGGKILDAANSIDWIDDGGTPRDLRSVEIRAIQNATDLIAPASGWVLGNAVEVELDAAFYADILGNVNNRGILLLETNDLGHPDENWQVHMKEWGTGERAAYLRVEMVPEPATMLLLGLGGLGLVIRRKR